MKTVTLFRHQERGKEDGLSILIAKRGLGIFFDAGLGKSLTALSIFDWVYQDGCVTHLVIVCPKTIYGTWQSQIAEHSEYEPAFEYYGEKVSGKKYKNELLNWGKSHNVLLVNYEAFRSPKGELVDALSRWSGTSLVVADESTKIKNPSSQQSKGMRKLFGKYWGRVIMTGTEITKSPLDLFNQFEFLKVGIWGERNFYTFRQRYAIMEPLYLPGGNMTKKVVGFQRINHLQKIVEPWIVRAKKEDCLDLPPKIFQNIPVELDAKEWKAYQDLKKRLITILESGEVISVEQKVALFMRFRTITGGWADTHNPIHESGVPSKLSVLIDHVEDDDSQAIIWASFTHEITMIEKELKSYGNCVTYYGGVSQEDRQSHFDDFVRGNARFFIASPMVAALGLNLQHCPLQYYYSLPTRGDDYLQSLDRSHRIGTTQPVVYRFLLGRHGGTDCIDWRVKALLDQSADLLHAFQTREVKELLSFV